MQSGLIAFVTAAALLGIGKLWDDWNKRREARRTALLAAGREGREDEAEEIRLAEYYRGDNVELRKMLSQFRLDFDNERRALHGKIADLTATNERQEREIVALKAQIFDLQEDRKRQTDEGRRQTNEGIRQTREGERQTREGQRLDERRADMDEEENGGSP